MRLQLASICLIFLAAHLAKGQGTDTLYLGIGNGSCDPKIAVRAIILAEDSAGFRKRHLYEIDHVNNQFILVDEGWIIPNTDKYHGARYKYKNGGERYFHGSYVYGNPVGLVVTIYQNRIDSTWYQFGSITKLVSCSLNGSILQKAQFVEGKLHGDYLENDANGKKKVIGNFNNGKILKLEFFDPKGKIKEMPPDWDYNVNSVDKYAEPYNLDEYFKLVQDDLPRNASGSITLLIYVNEEGNCKINGILESNLSGSVAPFFKHVSKLKAKPASSLGWPTGMTLTIPFSLN